MTRRKYSPIYNVSIVNLKLPLYIFPLLGIPQLVQLLSSENEEVKEAAATALVNLTTAHLANIR